MITQPQDEKSILVMGEAILDLVATAAALPEGLEAPPVPGIDLPLEAPVVVHRK